MRMILVVACLSGALSVVLGATGAHALDAYPERTRSFDTALRYHQLYSVVLLILAFAVGHWGGVFGRRLRIASRLKLIST